MKNKKETIEHIKPAAPEPAAPEPAAPEPAAPEPAAPEPAAPEPAAPEPAAPEPAATFGKPLRSEDAQKLFQETPINSVFVIDKKDTGKIEGGKDPFQESGYAQKSEKTDNNNDDSKIVVTNAAGDEFFEKDGVKDELKEAYSRTIAQILRKKGVKALRAWCAHAVRINIEFYKNAKNKSFSVDTKSITIQDLQEQIEAIQTLVSKVYKEVVEHNEMLKTEFLKDESLLDDFFNDLTSILQKHNLNKDVGVEGSLLINTVLIAIDVYETFQRTKELSEAKDAENKLLIGSIQNKLDSILQKITQNNVA